MARGWESKSVEEQIESAERRRPNAGVRLKTVEEIEFEHECASIEMNRTRILHEMDAATHPRHREMLAAALRHLDSKLLALAKSRV